MTHVYSFGCLQCIVIFKRYNCDKPTLLGRRQGKKSAIKASKSIPLRGRLKCEKAKNERKNRKNSRVGPE